MYVVDCGRSLRDDTYTHRRHDGWPGIDVPVFLRNPDGSGGFSKRQCTTNYKIRPIRAKVRELLEVPPRGYIAPGAVEQWLGITTNEAVRMKPSGLQYTLNRWPLIEAGMSAEDCVRWFHKRYPDRPLEKSACMGCPYQSRRRWVEHKRRHPEEFAELVEIDERLRDGTLRYQGQAFLHPSRTPLRLAVEAQQAQGELFDVDGFGNECEGHCGV